MTAIVFLATAWGAADGGINAFNTDICLAVAAAESKVRVVCVVPFCTATAIKDAARKNVKLVSLQRDERRDVLDPSDSIEVLEALQSAGVSAQAWWIGHDLHTGPIAESLRDERSDTRAAVILHTRPIAYEVHKRTDAGDVAIAKNSAQEQLLAAADAVFAVGPRLVSSAHEILAAADRKKHIVQIVPGLLNERTQFRGQSFRAVTFGRFDSKTDKLKQGKLLLQGFAHAMKGDPEIFGIDPSVTVVGVARKMIRPLVADTRRLARRDVLVNALPYTIDRAALLEEVRKHSAAAMLSLHEGFGLAAWEAIGLKVPLILSKNSGVYDLIASRLAGPGLGCVRVVDVRGGRAKEDVTAVSVALQDIHKNRERWLKSAESLRAQLGAFTWEAAAEAFLTELRRTAGPRPTRVHAPQANLAAGTGPETPQRIGPRRQVFKIGKAEIQRVRDFWKGRSDLFGNADAERDTQQSSWMDELFVDSPSIRRVTAGTARVVVGRKGAGKSAARIAAAVAQGGIEGERFLSLAVSADEAFAEQADALSQERRGILSSGGWYRAFSFHLLQALMSQVSLSPTTAIVSALLDWCKANNFTERNFSSLVTDAATVELPRLLLKSGAPEYSVDAMVEMMRRPTALYVDDFDKLYQPGNRTRSVENVRSALESVDKLAVGQNARVVTILLREDLWLLCRTGWSYLDKMGDVVDLRWSEDLLRAWTEKRLRRAVAAALDVAVVELPNVSFDALWEVFFPGSIQLENGKQSRSFGYILRRTLYTPRDVYKFVARIGEIAKEWPASQNIVEAAEREYARDRLEYLVTEFGSLCDGLSVCLHSFSTKTMALAASDLFRHLKALRASGEVRLLDSLIEGDSEVSLARFLFRIGFLEVRYQEGDRWEVRDALRYPDHWKGIRRDDSLQWAVRSTFFRVLESHRKESAADRIARLARDEDR